MERRNESTLKSFKGRTAKYIVNVTFFNCLPALLLDLDRSQNMLALQDDDTENIRTQLLVFKCECIFCSHELFDS